MPYPEVPSGPFIKGKKVILGFPPPPKKKKEALLRTKVLLSNSGYGPSVDGLFYQSNLGKNATAHLLGSSDLADFFF